MTVVAPSPDFHPDLYLDESFYHPSPQALEFLHATIVEDDDQLKEIVFRVQREAYAIHPFPCIRLFAFLSPRIIENSAYASIIANGRKDSDALFVDLGCGMGSDVRKLVHDGFPGERVLGFDIFPAFFDMGHKLWNDAKSCKIKFLHGNAFDLPEASPSSSAPQPELESLLDNWSITSLMELRGRTRYVFLGAIFHLFDGPQQAELARTVAGLLTLEKEGTVVFGWHLGVADGKEGLVEDFNCPEPIYCHSPRSWTKLWKDTLANLKGEDFVEKHVRIDAGLFGPNSEWDPMKAYDGERNMRWSVFIV